MSESIDTSERCEVPDLLGVPEAAALLRIGLTFAYESTARFIATGSEHEIPAIKVGRLTRVPRVALERFMGVPITWPIPVAAMPAVRPSQSARSGVSRSRVAAPRLRGQSGPSQSAPRLFGS
jgi:excisionase family DNA binding protein